MILMKHGSTVKVIFQLFIIYLENKLNGFSKINISLTEIQCFRKKVVLEQIVLDDIMHFLPNVLLITGTFIFNFFLATYS